MQDYNANDAPRDDAADPTAAPAGWPETDGIGPEQSAPDDAPEQWTDDAPPAAPEQPPTPDERDAALAQMQRENAALRGNVTNAAAQARRQTIDQYEARLAQRQQADERQQRANLQTWLGEQGATDDQKRAYLRQFDAEAKEREADRKLQAAARVEQQLGEQQTRMGVMGMAAEAHDRYRRLTTTGAELLAQDTGLTADEVRRIVSRPAEQERFQRAYLQGAVLNSTAFDDYMESLVDRMADLGETRQQARRTQTQDNRERVAAGNGHRAERGGGAGVGGNRWDRASGDEVIAAIERAKSGTFT